MARAYCTPLHLGNGRWEEHEFCAWALGRGLLAGREGGRAGASGDAGEARWSRVGSHPGLRRSARQSPARRGRADSCGQPVTLPKASGAVLGGRGGGIGGNRRRVQRASPADVPAGSQRTAWKLKVAAWGWRSPRDRFSRVACPRCCHLIDILRLPPWELWR